ncbi:tetratricopeptide repeat protein [Dethiothermospora halolimnae]|uniref:tetratricopeptide repeat protein n=1 Tax=Dethiothermospora halolimnae TaxID=3114390 RepID=UPI003CCB7D44
MGSRKASLIFRIKFEYKLARSLYKQKKYDKCIECLNHILQLLIKCNCNYNMGKINTLLRLSYRKTKNIEKALYHIDRAIKFYDLKKRSYGEPLCQIYKGNILLETGDYDKSIDYFKRALNILEKKKKAKLSNNIRCNIITALIKKEDYKEASKYFSMVNINILNDYNKTVFYYNMGRYYIHINRLDKAEECLLLAKDLTNNKEILYDIYIELSNINSIYRKYEEAYKLSQKAREILKRIEFN